MYAVVGCRECGALWVVEGEPETTGCPRCGTTRQFRKLRKFAETDDADAAREARAALLAERQGESGAFGEVPDFATLGSRAEEAVVTDEEFLEGSGLDAEAIAEAGERAEGGNRGGNPSREAIVREAIRMAAPATEDAVVARATDRGVPEATARELVTRLRRAGDVVDRDGELRLV